MPHLITMLTNNDETVSDALETFLSCCDLDCRYWGFKDVGLPPAAMKALVEVMKEKGKVTFLESVVLGEAESARAARLAIQSGFNYFMGTVYSPGIQEALSNSATKYLPFCGSVHGHPTILDGTPGEIVEDAKRLERLHVAGVDLLAYRNPSRPEEIARAIVRELRVPVVIAGSIDSFERIDSMKRIGPWAFTIGSAFFSKKFVPAGTFRDQLQSVISFLGD
jgi:hypothetical protein